MAPGQDDPRAELAQVAASLRAYLEWQEDSGAHGIPRRPKGARPATATATATATPTSTPTSTPTPTPTSTSTPTSTPTSTATAAATPVAKAPRPLQVVADEVKGCRKCGLAETRTNTVFSRGNPEAKLVFVGEAPGADEDEQGLPFVGRAGQLLDKMIGAMGLSPDKDVYVCNIIKCRPPGNRRPTPEETSTCIPYLHEQLAIIKPKVIVAMGNTAVSALLDTKLGITKLRGQWKLYKGKTLVMPTYHPSYLLRPSAQQVQAKREAWDDLRAVMKELGLPPAPKK